MTKYGPMTKADADALELVLRDIDERILELITRPSNPAEICARALCDANNIDYESHTVDESGEVHITGKLRTSIDVLTLTGVISV